MSEETNGTQSQDSKVVFKYQGEVVDELDWNVPADREKIVQRAHRGIMYDKVADDLHAAKKERDTWEGLLEGAKSDPEKLTQLVGMIEGYIGKPLTEKQVAELHDDAYTDDLSTNPVVKKLQAELNAMKEQTEKAQAAAVSQEIQRIHKNLMVKYDGSSGLPKYEVDEVEKYITDNSFYLKNIDENYEQAYFMLNKDKILAAERKKALEDNKKLKVGDDGIGRAEEAAASLKEQKEKPKSYDDIVNAVLRESKEQGKAIILDD